MFSLPRSSLQSNISPCLRVNADWTAGRCRNQEKMLGSKASDVKLKTLASDKKIVMLL